MSEALKPCPFCGSNKIRGPHLFEGENRYVEWWAECEECPCHMTLTSVTRDELVEAWNRRAAERDAARLAAIENGTVVISKTEDGRDWTAHLSSLSPWRPENWHIHKTLAGAIDAAIAGSAQEEGR